MDSAKGANCQAFHLLRTLDAAFGQIMFDVRPDRVAANEMRRVGRQEVQP